MAVGRRFGKDSNIKGILPIPYENYFEPVLAAVSIPAFGSVVAAKMPIVFKFSNYHYLIIIS